ncbi:hypothetical protein D3C84_667420 [compost metagenome]
MGPADFHHLHARIDQVDHRFEAGMVERVGQQSFRRVVGRDQQQDAPAKQRLEQSRDQHGVADVMDVKLVETQHAAIVQQFIERGGQRVRLFAMVEHPLVQPGEEFMEVQALLLRQRNGLEKAVEQPALATAHGAMQIKPGQVLGPGFKQRTGVLRHAVDHPLLAVTEGVALGDGLVMKVVVNDPVVCRAIAVRGRCLTEEAAQRRPARCESRAVGRSNGQCDVTP